MKDKNNSEVRTASGAKLGERVFVDDKPCLKYKAGHKIEILAPKTIVELITDQAVDQITFIK